MHDRPAAGPGHWPATLMLLFWGGAEAVLRLRLAARPGWRDRLGGLAAVTGRRLREWTIYLVMPGIGAAVLAALWFAGNTGFGTGGGQVVVAAGLAIAAAGIALRIWAIVTLDEFFTFVVGIADDHRVVEHGPYRVLRHPGYAGVLLTLLGVGLALGNWLSLALIVVVPAAALAVRIVVEEATLARALGGEYAAYAARTARLIPGLW